MTIKQVTFPGPTFRAAANVHNLNHITEENNG